MPVLESEINNHARYYIAYTFDFRITIESDSQGHIVFSAKGLYLVISPYTRADMAITSPWQPRYKADYVACFF